MSDERPHGWYLTKDGRTVFGPLPARTAKPTKVHPHQSRDETPQRPKRYWAPIDPWRER